MPEKSAPLCDLCWRPLGADPIRPGPEWPLVDRACFERFDAEDEALELEHTDVLSLAKGEFPSRPVMWPRKYLAGVQDLIGQRLGRFVVKGITHRVRRDGRRRWYWRLRCDCGDEVLVPTSDIGKPGRRDGIECGTCTRKRLGHDRAAVYGGLTIAELAVRAGVSENAIRKRVQLGWSTAQLLAPAIRSGARRAA